jgi:hypothetical protein
MSEGPWARHGGLLCPICRIEIVDAIPAEASPDDLAVMFRRDVERDSSWGA